MSFVLTSNEINLLMQLKSVDVAHIRLVSCRQEQADGTSGFRCGSMQFGENPVITIGITLEDEVDIFDVEMLWVRSDVRVGEITTPLARVFPLQAQAWDRAGTVEVAVLAAVSPRRRFWDTNTNASIKHDAGLRLGSAGSEIFVTPSQMPFGDLFVSATLPSGIDGSFDQI